MLEIQSLSKTYANGENALSNISLSIKNGEVLGVVGHSGAGKSTLLRCINRLIEYDGNVNLDGVSIKKANKKELRMLRCRIGMVFQNYSLVENLSVLENVLHGCLGRIGILRGFLGIYKKQEKIDAISLIEAVGLKELATRSCSLLSGGEKQRVGIARALMQKPSIILADEPTSSLDISSSNIILKLLRDECKERGIAAIINLHQIELAKQFCDRIVGLKKGCIVFNEKSCKLDEEALKRIF